MFKLLEDAIALMEDADADVKIVLAHLYVNMRRRNIDVRHAMVLEFANTGYKNTFVNIAEGPKFVTMASSGKDAPIAMDRVYVNPGRNPTVLDAERTVIGNSAASVATAS